MDFVKHKDQFEPTFKEIFGKENLKDFPQNITSIRVSPKENEVLFIFGLNNKKKSDVDKKISQDISNNPTLKFLYEQIEKLTEQVKKIEHLLCYQKAMAVSGSSISVFFRSFSQAIGQERIGDISWVEYFEKLTLDTSTKEKCDKISLKLSELQELADLHKKNTQSHPKVEKNKVEELVKILQGESCKLKVEEFYDFTYLKISKDAFVTLGQILSLYLPYQELNESKQVKKMKKDIKALLKL